KENYSFVVADEDGMITGGEHGLYNRDTRMLSRYAWQWQVAESSLQTLVVKTPRPDTLHAHHALIEGPSQLVAVRRTMTLTAASLLDELEVSNTSLQPLVVDLTLDLAADFIDLFEARGWAPQVRPAPSIDLSDGRMEFRQRASDAVVQGVSVAVSGAELDWSVMGAAAGHRVDLPTVPTPGSHADHRTELATSQPAQGSAV